MDDDPVVEPGSTTEGPRHGPIVSLGRVAPVIGVIGSVILLTSAFFGWHHSKHAEPSTFNKAPSPAHANCRATTSAIGSASATDDCGGPSRAASRRDLDTLRRLCCCSFGTPTSSWARPVGLRRGLARRRLSVLEQQRIDRPPISPRPAVPARTPTVGRVRRPVEEGDAGGPGRIDRSVTDRDRHKVDERQRQTDSQRPEPLRGPVICRTQHHDEEERRQQDLNDDHGSQRVVTGRVVAVSVRGHVPDG